MAPSLVVKALLLGWAVATAAQEDGGQSVESVDYAIVGGGPAGFVVAEYLSRDPSVHVLLLETGPDASTNFTETSKRPVTLQISMPSQA